jgi:hypothetical protein
MDVGKIKGRLQAVFSSYVSLLAPIGITLVAVLLFIPTQLISSRLQREIQTQSVSKGEEIRRLTRTVPSSEQWKTEQEYQEKLKRDADEIGLLVKQTTQRELLSYEIFPEPKHDSPFIFDNFGRAFRRATEELATQVNAGTCPTKAELERTGRGWSKKEFGDVDATIKDGLCREKAESASVYASPADLAVHEFWGKYKYAKAKSKEEAVKDCWYSQLAYWIIEDVYGTIAACNSRSSSVFTSSVKRLLSLSFTSQVKRQESKSSAKTGGTTRGDKPKYVRSAKDALTKSCTNRFSKDAIDVTHFKVSVVLSTDAVLPFMQKLCSAKQHKFSGWDGKEPEQILKHNQITVLEYSIASVDRERDVLHELYRYGEDAVVKLDLTCEYIFSKAGYEEIKPEAVKEDIKGSSVVKPKGRQRPSLSPGRKGAPPPGTRDDSLDIGKIGK